jgi:glutathione S-transferase
MKLYFSPGACSVGIHVLLEEIGKPYEALRLDLRSGEQHKPDFATVNPKGKVPTLVRDDGKVITEYPVIAHYLAKTNPATGLMPKTEDAEIEAASATDYCVATIHMQGFSRLFRPSNFAPNESDAEAVKARGRELIEKGYALMDKTLGGKQWVAGDYSYADSALFYVEFWGAKRMGLQLPSNLAAHFERMLARPAVKRTLEQEGLQA